MKRLLLGILSVFVLVGCETMQQMADSVNSAIGIKSSQSQELDIDEFCSLRNSDINTAKRRFSGKEFNFSGIIKAFPGGTFVEIKSNNSILMANFEEFDTTYRRGDFIRFKARITAENFNGKKQKQCTILLEHCVFID